MCGIIGYIGPRQAVPLVVGGLDKLAYRGYDSAGVAVVGERGLILCRSVGKLENLKEKLKECPLPGTVAIGHTRWATHGKPTEINAHPHTDCTGGLVVVHNGIIENYLALRHELVAEGHTFDSETDTEIIAHLIERYHTDRPLDEAVRAALTHVEGAYAIAVISSKEPGRIVSARCGSAGGIVVGLGKDEVFLASDAIGILEHTRRLIFLENRQMVVLSADEVQVTDLQGEPMEADIKRVSWDPLMAAKGEYKHFMLKEIFEQPRAVIDTIGGRVEHEPPGVYLEDVTLSENEAKAIERVLILACGTSWHAGTVGKFLIESLVRIPVEVDYASEFRYRDHVVNERTLVVAITQSGETADTLAAMDAAIEGGGKIVTICNVIGSMATRKATHGVVYTHAGPEIGVASTKSFTSQIVALYLLTLYLGSVKGTLSQDRLAVLIRDLEELPRRISDVLERTDVYTTLAHRYEGVEDFLYLGRGINYPIALEGALKLKEISYIHAEGYPAGEMKHGPIALITDEMPVVVVVPLERDPLRGKVFSNMQEVLAREGKVIAVVPGGLEDLPEGVDAVIPVPSTSPLLYPILAVIPLQLLSYHIAVRRGCDVDQPRNLAKSVTVE